jgi:hypothetical protein
MAVMIQRLALVSESQLVDVADVMRVAAALQKQASRDVAPIWDVSASVDPFAELADVPAGHWPMIIRDDIGFNAAGIHLDDNGQPFALISSSSDIDEWSLTASHETLEMLVDPFGNRLMAGDSPKLDQGRVNFLVEVCDPSESAAFAYSADGIVVSDFYTPNYFDPVAAPGVRYSFTGAITEPRDVLRGGYLSWVDPETNIWWQEIWFNTPTPTFRELGVLSASNGSMRVQIDRITGQDTASFARNARRNARAAGLTAARNRQGNSAWADRLHTQIAAISGGGGGQPGAAVSAGPEGEAGPTFSAAVASRGTELVERRSAPRAWA